MAEIKFETVARPDYGEPRYAAVWKQVKRTASTQKAVRVHLGGRHFGTVLAMLRREHKSDPALRRYRVASHNEKENGSILVWLEKDRLASLKAREGQ